jgi:hypothetical protein
VKMASGPFSATWSTPLHTFLKFAWQASDFSVAVPEKADFALHADNLTINAEGTDKGSGRIDQTTDMVVSNFTVRAPSEDIDLKIAKIDDKTTFTGFDILAYQQQMEKLRTLIDKVKPAAEPAGAQGNALAGNAQAGDQSGADTASPAPEMPALTDEDRKALAELVAALPKTISGYSTSVLVEGIAVSGKDGTPFRMAHAGSDLAFKGIDTDKAELDFALKHDGLEVQSPEMSDPRAQALLPKAGSLSLRATDLPVPSLVQAVAKTLPELTSGDQSRSQSAQFALMAAFMTTLGKSNIKLTIDRSWLDAAKAHLTADGAFNLAAGVPTGTVNLGLTGLDEVTAMFTAVQDPISMNALPILQQMHDLAKRETGSDGKPVDKYAVTYGSDGMITINGKPMGPLGP